MPFLKGKIGFTPLKVIGRDLPDATTIESQIVLHPYRPLGEKESSRMSFVTPMTTIPEEFEQTFENPLFRDFVLAGVVIEQRKVDMAVVRARTNVEFEKAQKLYKVQGRPGLGGNKPDKKEIKARVIEEELPKAPIARRTFEVLFAPGVNMIFVSTSSAATLDALIPHIKFVVFNYRPDEENGEEQGEFLIMNALKMSFLNMGERSKLAPFCFVDGQEAPPIEVDDYMREWLTWLMLTSLESEKTGMKVQVDKTVRLRYSPRSDLEQSQFKARHDNIPIQTIGVEQAAEGGLVDDITLYLSEVDLFSMGSTGCDLRINKAGFISNVAPPKMKAKEKDDLLPFVMEGVVTLFQEIAKLEERFFKLRKSLSNWTDEVVKMRAAAVEYAEQHLDYELKLSTANPEDLVDESGM